MTICKALALAVLLTAAACVEPVIAPTDPTSPPIVEKPHTYDCEDRRVEIQAYVDRTGVKNTILRLSSGERVYLVDSGKPPGYRITHYDGPNLHCSYDVP